MEPACRAAHRVVDRTTADLRAVVSYSRDVVRGGARSSGLARGEARGRNDDGFDGGRPQAVSVRGGRPADQRPGDVARSGAPDRRLRLFDTADARRPALAARPGPALAVAATLTDLRVGTWVYASPLRPAWHAAWEAHSLSLLTEGRFEMGIGTGRPGIEDLIRELGMPDVSSGERLTRVHDTVAALRDLDGPDLHTPVVMAVRGPKARTLAVELADTVNFALPPGETRGDVMRLAREFHARPGTSNSRCTCPSIGDSVAPFMAPPDTDTAALHAMDSLAALPSEPAAAAEEIQRRREEIGFSYFIFGADFAEAFAPIVAELAGH